MNKNTVTTEKDQFGFGMVLIIIVIVIIIGALGWYVFHSLNNVNASYTAATSTSNNAGPKFSRKSSEKNSPSLSGVITEGPTSPLSQSGTSNDAPVTNHIVQALNAEGKAIASTKTDSQGKYVLHLAPGTYTIVLVPKVGLADPPNNTVQVKTGANTLDLSVDTGIR